MKFSEVHGDLLDQDVEAIVNPWNRNFIPWWLLLPQGVSGAIKKRGGYRPFRELARSGLLQVGEAVATHPGRLPFKAIIHVAGLHATWVASERSVRLSTTSALNLANELGIQSIAFPIIGGGTGGLQHHRAVAWMGSELEASPLSLEVRIVHFSPAAAR